MGWQNLYRQRYPELGKRLMANCWIGLNEGTIIQDSLNYLVDYGYLNAADIPTTDSGGRPTTNYHKHSSMQKN